MFLLNPGPPSSMEGERSDSVRARKKGEGEGTYSQVAHSESTSCLDDPESGPESNATFSSLLAH